MHIVFALVLALLVIAGSEAQTDPSKALIGKWQGEIQYTGKAGNPNRVLVIESVSQKEGRGWIAEGRYGVTKASGKVHIDVDTTGKVPSIRFVTDANSIVKLNLVNDKWLTGTITYAGTSQRGNDRSMKLEKVE